MFLLTFMTVILNAAQPAAPIHSSTLTVEQLGMMSRDALVKRAD
jgi:hypothetical protein